MSSKNLIISFVTVSVISLAVSAFAILTAARSYAQRLGEEPSAILTAPYTEDTVTVTEAAVESTEEPVTATPDSDLGIDTADENTEGSVAADASEAPETTKSPVFILGIKDERLTVTDYDGNVVYERIIDLSDIRENDLELLRRGISFSDTDSAISAIYDLIS